MKLSRPLSWFIPLLISLVLIAVRIRGLGIINAGFWDYPILLDGGWRVFNGQIPHHDFSTVMGSGLLGLVAVGMHFVGANASAIDFAQLVLGSIGMALALYTARKYLHPLAAGAFGIVVATYFFTPRMLSYGFDYIGYVGLYNLLAFCLFSVLLAIELFRQHDLTDAALAALIVFLLFITKFPFGIAGFGLVLVRLVSDAATFKGAIEMRQRILHHAILFSLVLMLLLGGLFLLVGLQPMLRDILIASQSRAPTLHGELLEVARGIPHYSLEYLTAFTVLAVLIFHGFYKSAVVLGAGVLASILLTLTIQQLPEDPLLAVVGVLAFSVAVKQGAARRTQVSLIVLSLLGAFNGVAADLKANLYQLDLANRPPISEQSFYNSSAYGVRAITAAYVDAATIVKELNPAKCSIKILTVDAPNPVSAAMDCPPAKGAPLYWHNGTTFSLETARQFAYFKPEHVFSDVDVIFVPTAAAPEQHDTGRPFMDVYGEYLNDKFKVYRTTKLWHVFVRPSLCNDKCLSVLPLKVFNSDFSSKAKIEMAPAVNAAKEKRRIARESLIHNPAALYKAAEIDEGDGKLAEAAEEIEMAIGLLEMYGAKQKVVYRYANYLGKLREKMRISTHASGR